jgi:hypothetical protein
LANKQLMTLNKDENVYYGVTSDSQKIRVKAEAYADAQRDPRAEKEEINDPDWWALRVADDPRVAVVNDVV